MARVNKKSIFEKYGIIYDSKTGKIYNPEAARWETLPLKHGNKKLDKSVLTWGMLPGVTCPNCSDCMLTCYVVKSLKMYPSVVECYNKNTENALYYIEYLEKAISAQIESEPNKKYIRVHVSGDMFSVEYIEMWERIANRFTDRIFWTYSKVWDFRKDLDEAIRKLDSLDNFKVVKSVISGKGINYGTREYIEMVYNELKAKGESVYICTCGGYGKEVKCGKECHACATYDYVLFLQH